MSRSPIRIAPLVTALALACGSAAQAAEAVRQIDRTFPAAAGQSFTLDNLAGNITVARATGSEIRLSATVHAAAGSQAEAERLADLLNLEIDESSGKTRVRADYPLDRYRTYSYPRRGDANDLPWFLAWLDNGSVNSTYDGVKVKIVSSASSSAPTLFADFRVEVPAGVAVSVDGMIGELRATGVEGDLQMEVGSGFVESRDGRGALSVETGSGDITVIGQDGTVSAESGSGDVRLERVTGDRVNVETGSGDVRLVEVRSALSAETGSGDIVGERIAAGATLDAETGSGDIRLAGDLGTVTRLGISTGSGDVTLTTDRAPAVRLTVSTGSGAIAVDLPAARITRNDRNDLRAEIGAATGTASISTGSGDVRLSAAN